MKTQELADKTVKFNSYRASLPIRGKVAYPCKWLDGKVISYLIYRPGFGGKWGSPEEVKIEDIVEILE